MSIPPSEKNQVLFTCIFSAYLYDAEVWWEIDAVSQRLLLLERKLLRSILCVKGNTTDDLLYLELDRNDIVTAIKRRQYSFFQKLLFLRRNYPK